MGSHRAWLHECELGKLLCPFVAGTMLNLMLMKLCDELSSNFLEDKRYVVVFGISALS